MPVSIKISYQPQDNFIFNSLSNSTRTPGLFFDSQNFGGLTPDTSHYYSSLQRNMGDAGQSIHSFGANRLDSASVFQRQHNARQEINNLISMIIEELSSKWGPIIKFIEMGGKATYNMSYKEDSFTIDLAFLQCQNGANEHQLGGLILSAVNRPYRFNLYKASEISSTEGFGVIYFNGGNNYNYSVLDIPNHPVTKDHNTKTLMLKKLEMMDKELNGYFNAVILSKFKENLEMFIVNLQDLEKRVPPVHHIIRMNDIRIAMEKIEKKFTTLQHNWTKDNETREGRLLFVDMPEEFLILICNFLTPRELLKFIFPMSVNFNPFGRKAIVDFNTQGMQRFLKESNPESSELSEVKIFELYINFLKNLPALLKNANLDGKLRLDSAIILLNEGIEKFHPVTREDVHENITDVDDMISKNIPIGFFTQLAHKPYGGVALAKKHQEDIVALVKREPNFLKICSSKNIHPAHGASILENGRTLLQDLDKSKMTLENFLANSGKVYTFFDAKKHGSKGWDQLVESAVNLRA